MLIPALDILNGQVVRLQQGDFDRQTIFSSNPIAMAVAYAEAGAQYLHIVDLDGAKNPGQRQLELITHMQQASGLPIQTGGGIRHRDDIARLLDSGISRVVTGSAAVQNPQRAIAWLDEFGHESLVFALDIHIDQNQQRWLATHGWQQTSALRLEDLLSQLIIAGSRHVLCTDIQRDGMLNGPNVELYAELKVRFPDIVWQASGGIAQLTDLSALKQANCDSAILGKALLREHFTIEEAIQCWQNV